MPRDTASRGWSPGDPVLFDGYNNGNHGAATSRKPLAAKKHAKQKDDGASTKPALPLQRQSTLSPWAKAAWKPGMRVVIAAPNNSSKQSTSSSTAPVEEAEEHRIKAHRSLLKGKQRLLEDNNKENFYEAESFTSNIQRSSTHQMSEHIPFQTSNIYEDPSPSVSSPHSMSRDKKAYYIQDDSPSSVKAVVSDNSRIDPDSSIEFLGHQRSSPHSRALRHIALAQANLLEANKHTTNGLCASTVSICSSLSSSITSTSRQVQLPYARRRIPFMRSPSPLQERSYTTSSDARDPKTEKKPIYSPELDWDDPVLNPAARSRMPSTPSSESSELPELPFKGTSANTATAKSVTLSCMESDARLHSGKAPLPPTSATWRSANTSNRREVDPAKVKRLRNAGRQHFRAERKARLQMKQAKEEELKDKFRTFSYDSTTAITPKIWYYRGLASGQIKFMGCDTRAGFSFDQPRSLEDVLSGLQGPLGWDLEWEPMTWNATFTKKVIGKAALLQLGDRNNIVLFQVERGSTVPECLLQVLEDPTIIKLGVQIKGDARKISRDYRWPSGAPILPRGLMDLSDLARHVHPTDLRHRGPGLISLQNLVAIYLEAFLEKGEVRTSKWEKQNLDAKQRKYAANDIFASVQLYQRIVGYAEVDNVEIDFETLIYDSVPKHDPTQGLTIAGGFQPRKTKPSRRSVSDSKPISEANVGEINGRLTPRVQEAWEKWWVENLDRDQIAAEMGVKPATVAGYIIKALTIDADLPYDASRLQELIKGIIIRNDQMDALQELLAIEEAPSEAPSAAEESVSDTF